MNNIPFETVAKIVEFASEAGRQEVLMAVHEGREAVPETDGGLWQSFQTRFPKEGFKGDYDAAVYLYSKVYGESVKNCLKAVKSEW